MRRRDNGSRVATGSGQQKQKQQQQQHPTRVRDDSHISMREEEKEEMTTMAGDRMSWRRMRRKKMMIIREGIEDQQGSLSPASSSSVAEFTNKSIRVAATSPPVTTMNERGGGGGGGGRKKEKGLSINDVISGPSSSSSPSRNNWTENSQNGDKVHNQVRGSNPFLSGGNNNSSKAALATIADFHNSDATGGNIPVGKGSKTRAGGNSIILHEIRPAAAEAASPQQQQQQHQGKWLFCQEPCCGFWTRKPERMTRHRLCHNCLPSSSASASSSSSSSAKRYKCPDCRQHFTSLAKLLKHDRTAHTGVADYECRVCDQEITDIKSHMKVNTTVVSLNREPPLIGKFSREHNSHVAMMVGY